MIVVDASVLANALADDGADGDLARERLREEQLVAPELVDLEVVSTLRRAARAGRLKKARSEQALGDLAVLPLRRVPHLPLLSRVWELRDNLTAFDAAYIALAEALDVLLLTADGPLAGATGVRCQVEVLGG
ncbi:MAG: type II toxin-antitoxin system VapC family toxin [Solirubrobacterales bacterium]|nr:type II toxin-antitoxin system VapC family toxin [Solirubrobacterales bacterium]